MLKKVKVTVIYPVTFETEIDDSLDDVDNRDKIYNEADRMFNSSSIDPIITECIGCEDLEE